MVECRPRQRHIRLTNFLMLSIFLLFFQIFVFAPWGAENAVLVAFWRAEISSNEYSLRLKVKLKAF
jgi:hypothetical protein